MDLVDAARRAAGHRGLRRLSGPALDRPDAVGLRDRPFVRVAPGAPRARTRRAGLGDAGRVRAAASGLDRRSLAVATHARSLVRRAVLPQRVQVPAVVAVRAGDAGYVAAADAGAAAPARAVARGPARLRPHAVVHLPAAYLCGPRRGLDD